MGSTRIGTLVVALAVLAVITVAPAGAAPGPSGSSELPRLGDLITTTFTIRNQSPTVVTFTRFLGDDRPDRIPARGFVIEPGADAVFDLSLEPWEVLVPGARTTVGMEFVSTGGSGDARTRQITLNKASGGYNGWYCIPAGCTTIGQWVQGTEVTLCTGSDCATGARDVPTRTRPR